MVALHQIEADLTRYEDAVIELHQTIQEAAEVVDLILAGGDSPRSKSHRLKILRRATGRAKADIELYERCISRLEQERRCHLFAGLEG